MLFTKLFVTKLFFKFSCVKSESKSVGSLSQLEAITSLPRSVCVLCSFRLAHCATVYIIYNSWSVTDHNNSRKRAAAQLVITLPHICCNVLLVTAWRSGTDSKILKKCLFSYCNHVYRGTQVKLKYRNLMKQLIPVSASVASVLWSLNAAHLIIILHFSHLRTQKVPGSSTNASSCWTVAVLRWPGPLLPTCQSFQEWPALPPRTPARRLKMENYWTTTPLLRTVALLVCSHLYTHHRMDVALKVHPSIFCIMM